jgi:hypothetical protein
VSAKATGKQMRVTVFAEIRRRGLSELTDPRLIAALEEFTRACLLVESANWPLSTHTSEGGHANKPGSRAPGRELYPEGVKAMQRLAERATERAIAEGRREVDREPQPDDYTGATEAVAKHYRIEVEGGKFVARHTKRGERGRFTTDAATIRARLEEAAADGQDAAASR